MAVTLLWSAASFAEGWHPPVGSEEVPLWPAEPPLARPRADGPELVHVGKYLKAGRPVTWVSEVTRPTIVFMHPTAHNTGVAVLVFPGGGYTKLAIDLEGTDVCDWLTAKGITCAVLKYRVPGSGHYWDASCRCHKTPQVPMALQDAQRAMVLLRSRAKSLGVDPNKIGVLGMSSGGHLVTAISNADALSYPPVDAADALGSRPNFGIALYPGHLWSGSGMDGYTFNHVSKQAPPTFILHAQDDPVDDVRNSIFYFLALRQAGIPTEMHIYAEGGHGFGLRRTQQPITHWTDLAETWLKTIGMFKH
ncbi:xylanase [Xanthomonas pisi DSM 18956]|nr:xylanase [Xanthomonas pisi DSM 18956]